jgi:hypothetical protein
LHDNLKILNYTNINYQLPVYDSNEDFLYNSGVTALFHAFNHNDDNDIKKSIYIVNLLLNNEANPRIKMMIFNIPSFEYRLPLNGQDFSNGSADSIEYDIIEYISEEYSQEYRWISVLLKYGKNNSNSNYNSNSNSNSKNNYHKICKIMVRYNSTKFIIERSRPENNLHEGNN